jgi:NACalpha-BTF3-like transcription factor
MAAPAAASPQSDSELEAKMAQEFAGFDKLPSLESIAVKRKDVMGSMVTPPDPAKPAASQTVAEKLGEDQRIARPVPSAASDVKFVHSSPEPVEPQIKMTHKEEEEEEDENEIEEIGEEDVKEEDESPIIQVPVVKPLKK